MVAPQAIGAAANSPTSVIAWRRSRAAGGPAKALGMASPSPIPGPESGAMGGADPKRSRLTRPSAAGSVLPRLSCRGVFGLVRQGAAQPMTLDWRHGQSRRFRQ